MWNGIEILAIVISVAVFLLAVLTLLFKGQLVIRLIRDGGRWGITMHIGRGE